MKRFLKRKIKFVSTDDLNTRYCYILTRGETFDANDIPIADAREILWIEDELRRRLIKAVGHDFYPPDMPTIAEVKSKPKPIPVAVEAKVKPTIKIKFPVAVINSFGSKAAQFTVEAGSKDEAHVLARKQTRKLGLRGATYKIS